jgi:hypothetical protein
MTVEDALKREIKYLEPFNHEKKPDDSFELRVAASL